MVRAMAITGICCLIYTISLAVSSYDTPVNSYQYKVRESSHTPGHSINHSVIVATAEELGCQPTSDSREFEKS